ncbi:hypothetical protein THIOSC13_80008 [uncultured Thiomicrorhabdus sp.]
MVFSVLIYLSVQIYARELRESAKVLRKQESGKRRTSPIDFSKGLQVGKPNHGVALVALALQNFAKTVLTVLPVLDMTANNRLI